MLIVSMLVSCLVSVSTSQVDCHLNTLIKLIIAIGNKPMVMRREGRWFRLMVDMFLHDRDVTYWSVA